MFETVNDLPADVRQRYTPDQQVAYLRVYNEVFEQTTDPVKAQAAAIGAVLKMDVTSVRVLRSAENGNPIVGGWAMKFSDASDTDSYDTFFARVSKLFLDYYTNAPLWWEHGLDNDYGSDPIGRRVKTLIFGFGVWLEHELYRNHFKFEETYQAVQNGEVSYSSDSIQHYAEQGFNEVNGRMDIWPFAGCALTRTPAETSLGPVIEMVALRSFNPKALQLLSDIHSDLEAREAQGTTENLLPVRKSSQGEFIMDPAKLAALAELLGCEATPQAVGAALQQLIAELQAAPPDAAAQTEQEAMMSQLRGAFGLPDTAKAADVVGKVEEIRSMLAAPARSKKLNISALKTFVGLVEAELDETPEDDNIPHFAPDDDGDEDGDEPPARSSFGGQRTASRPRQVGFRHNRGALKPGIMDVIGAITQIQGSAIQYQMPAFKSQRTSPRAALKAMNINNAQSGGWMLNREMSKDILQALYAELVFDKLGAKMVPMTNTASLTMNRVQSGAQAYWAGQGQVVSDANAKLSAAVTLQPRELVSKAIIENALLNMSANSGFGQSDVEDDIVKVMKLKMEYSGLYGSGSVPSGAGNTGAEPLGIYNTTGVTKTSLVSKNPTLKDLSDAEGRIEDTNLDYSDLEWLSSKRARRYFKGMTDAQGKPLFSDDWRTNDIRELVVNDHFFNTTTQVPNTTASQVTTTDIFLGDWANLLIGQGVDLEMVVDTSRYVEERSTLIQVVSWVDFGVAYKEAFQILTLAKVN